MFNVALLKKDVFDILTIVSYTINENLLSGHVRSGVAHVFTVNEP